MSKALLTTIITVNGREEHLKRTVRQLDEIDWDYQVLLYDGEPSERGHTIMSKRALSTFLLSDAETLVFLEDDVDIGKHFLRAVEALSKCDCSTLYSSGYYHYPARIKRLVKNKTSHPLEIFPMIAVKGFLGSQGIVLSRRATREMLGMEWHTQFDTMLPFLVDKMEVKFYSCFPNQVQHRAGVNKEKSVTSNFYRPHYSRSFGLDIDE